MISQLTHPRSLSACIVLHLLTATSARALEEGWESLSTQGLGCPPSERVRETTTSKTRKAQKASLGTVPMFLSGHNKPQSCMWSHSGPHATAPLSWGASGKGTFVHVPPAAHRRPSFFLVCVHKYTHVLQNKWDSLRPMARPITKGLSTYCPRLQPLFQRMEMPQEAFPLPTDCTALVQDDPATLSTWPHHALHPLCQKGCWKNLFLSVKKAYVANGQEMFTTEKMKRDFTDSTTKFQLFRRTHRNYKAIATCAGWAAEEEVEKKFIFLLQVTKKDSGRAINQLSPHYLWVWMLPLLLMHLFDSQPVLGSKAALLMLHITTLLFEDYWLRDASSPPEVSPDQISSFKNANLHLH